ncbi:MAG TPA: hypothetical protein VF742_16930 [Terracidiphilus sp.]|jgi:hypothetical protein
MNFGNLVRSSSTEDKFWKWFRKNEDTLFNFEQDQERIFDQLGSQMHEIHSSLTFEFSPIENNQREFVISADGIKDAFPAVEALYAAAPSLPRWKVIKFRPRREPADITYEALTVKASDVLIRVEQNGGLIGLFVYVPGYTKEAHYKYAAIVYLMLDQALGEYEVETKVGGIRIDSIDRAEGRTITLAELPKLNP